jgi:hypothetical protein
VPPEAVQDAEYADPMVTVEGPGVQEMDSSGVEFATEKVCDAL